MSDEKAIERREARPQVTIGARGIELRDLDQAVRFAEGVVRGGMAPKGMQAGGVVALIQAGQELGLPPMHALSKLTFVNGRLGIMGDASLALVRQAGILAEGTDVRAEWKGEGEGYGCTVSAKRAGASEWASRTFTVRDAKRAKLWGKSGPWSDYPDDMLYWRAWGRLAKAEFSDVLLGIAPAEEVRDYGSSPAPGEPPRDVTPPKGPDPLLEAAAGGEEPAPEPEESVSELGSHSVSDDTWAETEPSDWETPQGSLV